MEFTLDLNRWRCGGAGRNQLGDGPTYLENVYGFRCCLGQFINQLDKESDILDTAEPEDVVFNIPHEQNPLICHSDVVFVDRIANSVMSGECISVNDDEKTTVKQKIQKLIRILKKYGHTLKIKNNKLFDSKGRLININLLTNSLAKSDVKNFLNGFFSDKDFANLNEFSKELIKIKGVEKSKAILQKHIDGFRDE